MVLIRAIYFFMGVMGGALFNYNLHHEYSAIDGGACATLLIIAVLLFLYDAQVTYRWMTD